MLIDESIINLILIPKVYFQKIHLSYYIIEIVVKMAVLLFHCDNNVYSAEIVCKKNICQFSGKYLIRILIIRIVSIVLRL